jgi:hypothetical protein
MSEAVTDLRGRRIELRPVGVLAQLRLFKVLGPELSENGAYVGLARLAAAVSAIDGVPVPFPANEAGIEAALERLGDDGVDAVAEAVKPLSVAAVVAEAGN